ncbi:MAG: MBOAT family protein, partial [Nitrosopumilaceae archaeon]
MLFNSIDFVVFFAFVLSMFVIIKNRDFQHTFLLSVSYFFFFYSSNYLFSLLIFTTVWDYYLGKQIFKTESNKRKKIFLILSVSGNLSLLGFFKYADFAATQFNILGHYFNLNANLPLLNLALPIGISFYTFHSIGYIIDVYRGQVTPSKSLREYAIFVAFFPQLVAGPILRASQFLPQLREKLDNIEVGKNIKQILIHDQNLRSGITLMMFGFFKKIFIADNISPMVNEIFANPIGLDSFTIILGTIAFGIQIYCDFSGYTDIALGAARTMGFRIPVNFNKPYFATSPSDFWRRWHIS